MVLMETKQSSPVASRPSPLLTPPLGKIHPFCNPPLYIAGSFEPIVNFDIPFYRPGVAGDVLQIPL